jgi:two-component system, OmpR family, sensor histidine kinase KdpD
MTDDYNASRQQHLHDLLCPLPEHGAFGDLLAAIAHELRLPLSHIKGFVSSLRRTDVQWDEATCRDFLAEIEVETDRLTELVDVLLQTGVATDGSSEGVRRVLTSPEALIDGGLHRVRGLLGQRAVRLDMAGPLPRVSVDPGGIERVLANLLENAAKYSPPHSTIWISARVARGNLELTVQDAGPGIRPQDRQRIFAPFFRARTSEQRNVPGHGLGLAVCKSIVAAHGGDIQVDERPGGGASFTVLLPVRVRKRHMGRGNGTEDEGYGPANGAGCGRRSAHAPAHLQQPQGEWIRRAHGRRRGRGAQLIAEYPLDLLLLDIGLPVLTD